MILGFIFYVFSSGSPRSPSSMGSLAMTSCLLYRAWKELQVAQNYESSSLRGAQRRGNPVLKQVINLPEKNSKYLYKNSFFRLSKPLYCARFLFIFKAWNLRIVRYVLGLAQHRRQAIRSARWYQGFRKSPKQDLFKIEL